ncbi:hypothetical protein [Pseudomonas abietaniphila]|jgi:hypothetical protein|uniref:Uncharacterized protein n=1 Tax=Pseudomonas abietaniphila TaxID=89065 RepID=A0A1G7XZF7_9PSED|nr:hypothetical protein [Pseudomonas abietaniphila]SDG89585.1 hypothetical protein SAMN05216605_103449 [Pseudomonas abietaniphila]
MTRDVTLHVSFPKFGNNYYSQHVVVRKNRHSLIEDKRFDAFMMPSAENHFSNEVVGFNDQFRFLTDVLAMHLLDVESARPAKRTRPSAQPRSL